MKRGDDAISKSLQPSQKLLFETRGSGGTCRVSLRIWSAGSGSPADQHPPLPRSTGPRDLSSQLDDSICQIWVISGPASVASSGQRDQLHRAVFSPWDLSSQLEDLFCWIEVIIRPARHPHIRSTRLSASSSISWKSTRPAALGSFYL